MKNLLNWVKSNLMIVVCSAVAVLGIAGLFLGSVTAAKTVRAAEKRKLKITTIGNLSRTRMTPPSSKSGEAPKSIRKAITQLDVNLLKQLFAQVTSEYEQLFAAAVEHNRYGVSAHRRYGDQGAGHFRMADNLFPTPLTAAARIIAKQSYRAAFRDMLGPYSPDSRYPNLDSGMPSPQDRIQDLLNDLRDDFLEDKDKDTTAKLSEEDQDLLRSRLRDHAMKLLRERAESIHIYSEQAVTTDRGVIHFPDDIPFDIGEWSRQQADSELLMENIWEGQVGLWIQQDIVEAIARVNRVEDDQYNVMQAPVKRLVRMQVVRGYVGIDRTAALSGGMRALGRSSPYSMMRMEGLGPTADGTGGKLAALAGGGKDRNLKEDFAISHTGRGSNRNFDVRHVKVTIVIDSKRIPEFFEALSRVNYMTVLLVQIQDIDEYQALRKGFVYGTDDVVEMKMVVEAIWLRKWTREWMPPSVKNRLGMLKPGDEGYEAPVTIMPGHGR